MTNSPPFEPLAFWGDVVPQNGLAWRYLWAIMRRALLLAGIALALCAVELTTDYSVAIAVSPFEIGGAALSVLLVLRTNTGYDRWWEARKLWGGIVNQSRNLATAALAQTSAPPQWRSDIVRWTAAFAHATRLGLRSERDFQPLAQLIGDKPTAEIAGSRHPALAISSHLAGLIAQAAASLPDGSWALMRMERERMSLIDHLGGCERILKTPMPRAYAISLRQFLVTFLIALPLALIPRTGWTTPLAVLFVAVPLLSLDQIAADLENPFRTCGLNSLPLDGICAGIQADLLALLDDSAGLAAASDATTP